MGHHISIGAQRLVEHRHLGGVDRGQGAEALRDNGTGHRLQHVEVTELGADWTHRGRQTSGLSPVPATTDLAPGTRFTTGSVVVDGADARTVVDLCGYTHPLFAGDGPPSMVPGQIVLALAAGLLESSGRMGADVVALVGMDAVRFHTPLAPGEALTVDVEVAARRPTSRPGRELLDLDLQARCGDRPVAAARCTFLLARPAGDD